MSERVLERRWRRFCGALHCTASQAANAASHLLSCLPHCPPSLPSVPAPAYRPATWPTPTLPHCPLSAPAALPCPAGLAGYLAYPDSARSDIMLNFRQDDPLIQVGED